MDISQEDQILATQYVFLRKLPIYVTNVRTIVRRKYVVRKFLGKSYENPRNVSGD